MKIKIYACLLALLLSACGGGGNDELRGPPTNLQPLTNPAPSILRPITSVPPISYPDVERHQAFTRMNEVRKQVGLGLLQQNTLIDQAAYNHTKYMIINGGDHRQTPGRQLFSGEWPADRMATVGYQPALTNEIISFDGLGNGTVIVDDLIATAYHRIPILDHRWTDAGIGWDIAFPGSHIRPFVIDFAYGSAGRQSAPDTPYVLWPQPNTRTTSVKMPLEIPTPSPTQADGYGYPVSIQVDPDKRLKSTRFVLKELGAAPVDAYLLTYDNDINLVNLGAPFFAALAPKAPLKPLTSYNVEFEGTVDGQPLTVNWSFSTP